MNATKPDLDVSCARIPVAQVVIVFDPYEFHKARYRNEKSSVADRHESGSWLVAKGFIGLDGKWIETGEFSK